MVTRFGDNYHLGINQKFYNKTHNSMMNRAASLFGISTQELRQICAEVSEYDRKCFQRRLFKLQI